MMRYKKQKSAEEKPECPNADNHTPCPSGYNLWHEWAWEMGRRHYQIRCPGCNLFKIWIEREPDEPDYGGKPEDWPCPVNDPPGIA